MTWDEIVDKHKDHFSNCYCGYSCGPGWWPLIDGLSETIKQLDIKGFEYHQIKEKFGTLRIYWAINPETDDPHLRKKYELVGAMVRVLEQSSVNICEDCGKNGKAQKGGWIKTLCDECEKERYSHESKN